MAATFTLQSNSYDGRYLEVVCSQTQDIPNNKSTISWTLSTKGGASGYYYTGPTKLYIDGQLVYEKSRVSSGFPATIGSTSGKLTITHSSNGSKSINISLSTAIFTQTVSSKTGTWTLDSIPRAATISAATNFTDTTNPTITYSNPVGTGASALDAFIYSNDEKKAYVNGVGVSRTGTSYTFTLTQAQIDSLLTDSANSSTGLTVKFKLRSTIGGSYYWSNAVSKTFTVSGGEPTATMTVVDSNEKTKTLTGDENIIVSGQSVASYYITATAYKKASISKYYMRPDNQTTAYEAQGGTLTGPTTNKFVFTVVDSRGKQFTDTITKGFVDYIELTANFKSANISLEGETGAKIDIEVEGQFFEGSFGSVDNDIMLHYRYSTDNGTSWIGWIEFDEVPSIGDGKYSATQTISGLSYEGNYKIQVKVEDKLKKIETNTRDVSLRPVFDWSDTDFNFNVPISINYVELDYIVEQDEKDGWTYRKWNSGVAECWKILVHTTSMTQAWGALYCGNTITPRQSYPFTFKEKPVEIVNLLASASAGWLTPESGNRGMNGQYQTAQYNVVRPNSVSDSQTFNFAFYIKGKWK